MMSKPKHCPTCPPNSPWTNWHDIRCPHRGTLKERVDDMAGFQFAPLGKREKDHEKHVQFHQVTLDMKTEFKRALEKHAGLTPATPGMSNGERLAILVEEVGEVARAMTYDGVNKENLVEELIQVATMAAACVVGIRTHLKTEGV